MKSKYLRPISSLMFHLALFPCKQSPRSTLQHPNWALRNWQALCRAAEEGENKPKHVFLWPPRAARPCHATPCHARVCQASRLSPLPSVALGLCQPRPPFFFFFFLHLPFTSIPFSLSPPSIWQDSSRAGRWSPSAHSHLIKRSHSTVDNVTNGC